MSEKKKWQQVGVLRESKEGTNLVVYVDEDIKKGSRLVLQKPKDQITRLQAGGYITEEEAQKRIENLPAKLKYNIVLPPNDDE